MEYNRFITLNVIAIISGWIIYVGCCRSYSLYFFERDTKSVIFMEETIAIAIPIILSLILIVMYVGVKRTDAVGEEGEFVVRKSSKSRKNSAINSISTKTSYTELDSIPEYVADLRKGGDAFESGSRSASREEFGQYGEQKEISKTSVSESKNVHKSSLTEKFLEQLAKESEEVNNFELTAEGKIALDDLPLPRTSSRRKSSILDDNELVVERKRSQIYKEIGQISFLPSTFGGVLKKLRNPSVRNMPKQSLFDILIQLIGVHIPLWLSVMALYITLVEVFNNKLYYLFYYYRPGMKLLAMIISISIGLFHEAVWTWIVNDVLNVATTYVVIARIETASYFAGFVFLVGMISFDLFWTYGIDLLSYVMAQERPPWVIVIPWGSGAKKETISVIDIMVPGIFLNVIMKFADMYDSRAFFPPYYASMVGLMITLLIAASRKNTTPAMVLPCVLAIGVSLLGVDHPLDLWNFKIKR